ncbi:TPA: 50S ribosomal protein L23 [Candidatus Saccharibacteria bacterium]|nr:50S ribosomal protein L23 [Candidatus Saccharibacteria bacterium]HIO87398.1 50S ribosomal protein L23 [Candidatus Saccharibacteria bacterium]
MIFIQPRISEKSYFLSEQGNTYMFDVDPSANKQQIKEAVQEQYDVSVKSVRTAVAKGKVKTTPRKRRYPIEGKRKTVKRAYVTLMPGKTLPFFEDIS